MVTKKHILRTLSKILLSTYAISIFSNQMIQSAKAVKPGSWLAGQSGLTDATTLEEDINKCIIKKATDIENWESAIEAVIDKKSDGTFSFKESLIRENIGVNVDELNGLAGVLIDNMVSANIRSISVFEDYKRALRQYFTKSENLYNPQKRFMLLYLLKYLENEYKEPSRVSQYRTLEHGLIPRLFAELVSINEEVNRQVIINALDDADVDEGKRNVLKRIFALIQLSKNEYRYSKDSIYARILPGAADVDDGAGVVAVDFSKSNEYPTSPISHCETVVISLPYSMEFKEFLHLIGADNMEAVGMVPRQSTHSTKVDPKTGVAVESKGMKHGLASTLTSVSSKTVSGIDGLLSYVGISLDPVKNTYVAKNISSFMSQMDYQYGMDIPINQYNRDDTTSSRGHILISFSQYQGQSVAIVKLEDCGPGETSVTGHGHGASGKSNYISATGHIRLLNQYENRRALVCDARDIDKRELETKVSDTVRRSTSSGLVGTKFEFEKIQGHVEERKPIKGVKFCRCERRMLFGVPTYVNYGYVITDPQEFIGWCRANRISPEDYRRIVLSNNKWLYASLSATGEDVYSKLPETFLDALLFEQARFDAKEKDVNVEVINDASYGKINILDVPPSVPGSLPLV